MPHGVHADSLRDTLTLDHQPTRSASATTNRAAIRVMVGLTSTRRTGADRLAVLVIAQVMSGRGAAAGACSGAAVATTNSVPLADVLCALPACAGNPTRLRTAAEFAACGAFARAGA